MSNESIKTNLDVFDGLTISINTTKQFAGSPDPKDDYLFDLAFQSNSKILVTGDKKLLLFKLQNLDVMSLSDFKSILK